MQLIKLTLYRSGNDHRPASPVWVHAERIQCLEPHDTGTRIQFHLNEPSLHVQESPEIVISKIVEFTQSNFRRVK